MVAVGKLLLMVGFMDLLPDSGVVVVWLGFLVWVVSLG